MIQRIQSVFLLVAAIIAIVLVFISYGYVNTTDTQYLFNSLVLKYNYPDGHAVVRVYYVAFTFIVCAALSLIALFSYKNRVRQTQIISINMIVYLVALLLVLWICPDVIFKKYFAIINTNYEYEFAHKILFVILIAVEAVSLYLANRYIKKDEALVRSADRLR